jgi:hypothetical protein
VQWQSIARFAHFSQWQLALGWCNDVASGISGQLLEFLGHLMKHFLNGSCWVCCGVHGIFHLFEKIYWFLIQTQNSTLKNIPEPLSNLIMAGIHNNSLLFHCQLQSHYHHPPSKLTRLSSHYCHPLVHYTCAMLHTRCHAPRRVRQN